MLADNVLKSADVAQVKVVKGSDAYHEALIKEPPRLLDGRSMLLMACLLCGCFCQTVNGFDGSLFGGLTANKTFLHHFHGTNNGIWAGLVSAMYQIGAVSALPFAGPGVDTWGRKVGMLIGSFLIIMGTIITATTISNASVHQFMGGRFLLGFGVTFVSSAGPIYVVETAHPAYRALATAYCNCFWFTGSHLGWRCRPWRARCCREYKLAATALASGLLSRPHHVDGLVHPRIAKVLSL